MSGSVASASEPYLKDLKPEQLHKLGAKTQKTAKVNCQRMGTLYRMPFAWAAKPIFKPNRSLDDTTEFGPVYRQDCSKVSDEEIVKHLNELRSSERPKNVTIIPCQVSVTIKHLTDGDNIQNVLSPNLLPVVPFPSPPVLPATLEVQQFYSANPREADPFTEFVNVLYVFPKQLKYDAQKVFKARNIAVSIEFRDSDSEDAVPLKAIFGRPVSNQGKELVTTVMTSVLYHNTTPDFSEEVKIHLPSTYLNDKHHILFSFYHVSCAVNKKKDVPVESPIGK